MGVYNVTGCMGPSIFTRISAGNFCLGEVPIMVIPATTSDQLVVPHRMSSKGRLSAASSHPADPEGGQIIDSRRPECPTGPFRAQNGLWGSPWDTFIICETMAKSD